MADNQTIIMTFTNEAWTSPGSLQDLFLESFRVGDSTAPLLKHGTRCCGCPWALSSPCRATPTGTAKTALTTSTARRPTAGSST
ncbi:unnamed protein product [Urochloa humidicola]